MSAPSAPFGFLRSVVRALLVALALFWFVFAVLSGAEQYGEGIGAVFRNLPNALPWLALFMVVYIAFRWEHVGGVLIVLIGLVSVFFFNVFASPVALFAIALPLILLGGALILC